MFEEAVVDSPNVIMKVTERGGGDVNSAQVGDPLELHFEIFDQESPYEIFVRDLVAKDGNDNNEIVLIDSDGCPTESQIMGPLQKDVNSAKILLSNFDAFKFPTSEVVQFRALVTPCMPTCEPVECVYDDYYGSGDKTTVSSYGRKKRSAVASRLRRDTGNRVLVTNSFVVMDKFQHKRKQPSKLPIQSGPTSPLSEVRPPSSSLENTTPLLETIPNIPNSWAVPNIPLRQDFVDYMNFEAVKPTIEDSNAVCLNYTGLIVAIVVFLIVQIILAILWTHFSQKRKRKHEKDEFVKNMFNPYAVTSRS